MLYLHYQMKIKILNKKHKHSVIFKNKKIRCAKIQIIDSNILTHNPISLNNIKIRINIINTMTLIHSNKSNHKISTSTTNLLIHKIILNHLQQITNLVPRSLYRNSKIQIVMLTNLYFSKQIKILINYHLTISQQNSYDIWTE